MMTDSSNPTQLCRLCLLTSDNVLNVWETFEDLPIASILEEHFWFQVRKNDGSTEWICQLCWTQTKTFHKFYVKVKEYQESLRDTVEKYNGEPDETADIDNRGADWESDLNIVKCEETELIVQTIDSVISKDDTSEYSDDGEDNNFEQSDTDQTFDEKDQPPVEKLKNNDDTDTSNKLSEKEKQNAQIREFFNMKCEICSCVDFETLLEARKHYRKVHKTEGYLMCCGKKFWRRHFILHHILTHINPNAFRCDQCGKSCRTKNTLKMHIANHVPLDSRAHKCSLCSSSFTKGHLLRLHMKNKHSSINGEKFPCSKCDKIFRSKLLLSNHIRNLHEYSLDHVCEICARRFKTKAILRCHIISHHSATPPPKAQCNICGSWLKNDSSLRGHIRHMHKEDGSGAVKCSICKKVSKNKIALNNHIRRVHGEKRHQCKWCDKEFKRASNLKEHIALHTGEDLYNCSYCEKKFKSNANMYKHRKKAHIAEWTRDSVQRGASKDSSTNGEELIA